MKLNDNRILLKDLLAESITDVVWHYTMPRNALEIVKTNTFQLDTGTDSNAVAFSGKRQYYLSTTRVKKGGYGEGYTCRLELDGSKLSQNFKGGAIDYWGMGNQADEFEDRVYSHTPTIKNASRYIKYVDVWIAEDDGVHTSHQHNPDSIRLAEECLNKGIDCRVFKNKRDFESGRNGVIVDESNRDDILPSVTPQQKSSWVPMPRSPRYLDILIIILEELGVNRREIESIFNSSKQKKAYDDYKRNNPDVKLPDTYSEWIKGEWDEYESGLWSTKRSAADQISSGYHNAKKEFGEVGRELVVLINKQLRKRKVAPKDTIPYLKQLASKIE